MLLGRARARRYAVVGALCILAFGALIGVQPRILANVMDAVPLAPGLVNQSERVFAHDVALELWEGDPLLGVGSGNTAVAARHHPAYAPIPRRIVPAHNWLILGLAERGLIGAALLALLWCGPVLWLLFRGQGRADAALAACLTALMVSQWFDYELTYWLGGSLIQVALLALWIRPPAMPS